MKSFIPPLVLILFFSSCIMSTHVNYSDPNYLNSDEFSTYEEITTNNQGDLKSFTTDTTIDSRADYATDDYYDYSFSSRIRRFHRPMYYSGYYGGIYTDYYWYNNDPFSCGTSIYYGYNWLSPYYSYYSYSPFYFDYYTPYYYWNYYSFNAYNHNYHPYHNTYHNINNNNNAYIAGHRGSLSSNGGIRGINVYTTSKVPTLNIRDNNTIKNNTINSKNYKTNSAIKTNNRSNPNKSSSAKIKTNSNRKNTSYSNPKNNRNYNSNSRNNRSNSGNKSSRGGSRRSVNPRR